MGIIHLETFILAVIIFALTPGVDTIYILNRTISQGWKAGIYSSLGILSGVLFHITLAVLGLSIILAESALAFSIVKYLGAAYLIYLGIMSLLSKKGGVTKLEADKKDSMLKIYVSGVVTNVFNPKVALFFLAFFPQFIDPNYKGIINPFLSLGIIYILIDLVWCVLITFSASFFTKKVLQNPKISLWMSRVSGLVYIALGIKIALSKRIVQ
ncbi:LysE family translocator [Flavobacterium sp. AC]|uniref:LysE family translocator n=1 Tax=Flavobacterium azizsancarii TaxID=2961580 RepID=A0ABT4W811_9FLAO|nr:LysE family translocator [Flavobacterium azizsancarii]MDA6068402.1 LysE family translocator [Flavobacterium azizsancarii]